MYLELYGFAAVTAMMLFYALEAKGRVYILAFSAACLAAAVYASLIAAWPFAVVETIWAAVAVRRWQRTVPRPHQGTA